MCWKVAKTSDLSSNSINSQPISFILVYRASGERTFRDGGVVIDEGDEAVELEE